METTEKTENTQEPTSTNVEKKEPETNPELLKLQEELKAKQEKLAEYETKQKEIEEVEKAKTEAKLQKEKKFSDLIAIRDTEIAKLKEQETELQELREFKQGYEKEQEAIKINLLNQIEDKDTREIMKDTSIKVIEAYLKKTGKTVPNSPDNRVQNNLNADKVDPKTLSDSDLMKYYFDRAPIIKETTN